ncbi:MAG TPA: beta-ketoacyl-ACP synthase 3 [Mycobacteriales bacterium]|nr:beta-ketoacyl-ACP synthase 3 [Mycobacteriales bacterium]
MAASVLPVILGLGAYRPSRCVPNAEIVAAIDSSDEWIVSRSGIHSRYVAGPDEGLEDMAAAAAGKALGEAGLVADDVGLVLVTTMSNLRQAPPLAAGVAFKIGASGAGALDTGGGCAGFSYTLALAADAVRAGSARYVVVVGVERMTDIVDPTDRGTAFIFGDGAGAVVVGPGAADGIGPVRWGSDGSKAAAISQPYSWAALKDNPATPWPALRMAGQEVFRWAVTALAPVAADAVARAGLTLADIEVFVPHQANMRITDALVRGIGLGPEVVVAREIATAGNTSSASIPLAMQQLLASGQARSGQRALLMGFGAGLLYAAQVVRLP